MQVEKALEYEDAEELVAELRQRAAQDIVAALGAMLAQRRAAALVGDLREEANRLRELLPTLRSEATDAEQQMSQLDRVVRDIQEQLANLGAPRTARDEERREALRAQRDQAQQAADAFAGDPQRARRRVEDTIRRLMTIEGHIDALQALTLKDNERATLEELRAILSEQG
jgi:chromosome segregation ATPase